MNQACETGLVPLSSLFDLHDTDKGYKHHYEEEYERHFGPRRDEPLRLLEIGVGGYSHPDRGGEGLRAWRDYFPRAQVHGLDVFTKRLDLGPRVHLWRGAQTDVALLEELNEQVGPFDIVIDDGSHQQAELMQTFRILFPLLAPSGIYCIEDLGTSYDPKHGGHPELRYADEHVRFLLLGLIEAIHYEFSAAPDAPILKMVKSLHVSKELAIVHKQ